MTRMKKIGMDLRQGQANSALPGHFPSEFSFNPNQTHLNQVIIVFKTTRRLRAGEFFQGWSKSLQESGLEGPSLPITDLRSGGNRELQKSQGKQARAYTDGRREVGQINETMKRIKSQSKYQRDYKKAAMLTVVKIPV